MRCEDLTREIASPTGGLDPAEMAGHLAACPSCADWSRRAARFEQIWEATRPASPSMDALDALWARASAALDAAEVPATLRLARPAPRRRRATFAFARAAAVLIAGLVLLGGGGGRPVDLASREPIVMDLPVEDDHLAVVRIGAGGQAPRVEMQSLSRLYASSALPAFTPHDEFGDMEAGASSLGIVASP